MRFPFPWDQLRGRYVAVAVACVLLMGCARKLQIEVPASFHGKVRIVCTGLTSERTTTLRIDSSDVEAATCPARQADVVVTRAISGAPVETSVMWTTTGDGIVREILFDVK